MFGFDYMDNHEQWEHVHDELQCRLLRHGWISPALVEPIGTFADIGAVASRRSIVQPSPPCRILINRTYHLNVTYENPDSRLVAGFGRLYLPWAPSLDTIDGGYFGVRGAVTAAHSGYLPAPLRTPPPGATTPTGKLRAHSSILRVAATTTRTTRAHQASGLNAMQWHITRPFVFFENPDFL